MLEKLLGGPRLEGTLEGNLESGWEKEKNKMRAYSFVDSELLQECVVSGKTAVRFANSEILLSMAQTGCPFWDSWESKVIIVERCLNLIFRICALPPPPCNLSYFKPRLVQWHSLHFGFLISLHLLLRTQLFDFSLFYPNTHHFFPYVLFNFHPTPPHIIPNPTPLALHSFTFVGWLPSRRTFPAPGIALQPSPGSRFGCYLRFLCCLCFAKPR